MKTLEVNILDSYKLYLKETTYRLQGNLIVLSGINGSGKSQLLRIIAKSGKEPKNGKAVSKWRIGSFGGHSVTIFPG